MAEHWSTSASLHTLPCIDRRSLVPLAEIFDPDILTNRVVQSWRSAAARSSQLRLLSRLIYTSELRTASGGAAPTLNDPILPPRPGDETFIRPHFWFLLGDIMRFTLTQSFGIYSVAVTKESFGRCYYALGHSQAAWRGFCSIRDLSGNCRRNEDADVQLFYSTEGIIGRIAATSTSLNAIPPSLVYHGTVSRAEDLRRAPDSSIPPSSFPSIHRPPASAFPLLTSLDANSSSESQSFRELCAGTLRAHEDAQATSTRSNDLIGGNPETNPAFDLVMCVSIHASLYTAQLYQLKSASYSADAKVDDQTVDSWCNVRTMLGEPMDV
ncbi:hypothetical protein BC835DRAFT_1306373 [Cytidiella melzeri]|nr:hypothetical protein BC835DRAFT_1306373 [Cytidiella melzeri]